MFQSHDVPVWVLALSLGLVASVVGYFMTNKRKQPDPAELHNYVTQRSFFVPERLPGRPPAAATAAAAHWKCPKCGQQSNSSAAHCYHYTTGETFGVRPSCSHLMDPLASMHATRAACAAETDAEGPAVGRSWGHETLPRE